jgi:hypothetical protein
MIILNGTNITWFLAKPYHWTDPNGFKWFDIGAWRNHEGENASGLPIDTSGIALPNIYHTLGGWWRVNFINLKKYVITQQVDVGPNKGVVDLSAPLAYQLFGAPERVNRGPWNADYIGKELPSNLKAGIFNIGD